MYTVHTGGKCFQSFTSCPINKQLEGEEIWTSISIVFFMWGQIVLTDCATLKSWEVVDTNAIWADVCSAVPHS